MNKSLVTFVSENAPYGVRDTHEIEKQMILTDTCFYYGYDDTSNDEMLKEIFEKSFKLNGAMPNLDILEEQAWEHNSDLLHEMAIGYALDEYHQAGIDIEGEISEEELQDSIDSWYYSCLQMYSESNALDEAYEIHRYATKHGVSYIIPQGSDAHEKALCSFDIDSNKDIIMNHCQGVMFDEFVDKGDTVFNYGRFELHYMARG